MLRCQSESFISYVTPPFVVMEALAFDCDAVPYTHIIRLQPLMINIIIPVFYPQKKKKWKRINLLNSHCVRRGASPWLAENKVFRCSPLHYFIFLDFIFLIIYFTNEHMTWDRDQYIIYTTKYQIIKKSHGLHIYNNNKKKR